MTMLRSSTELTFTFSIKRPAKIAWRRQTQAVRPARVQPCPNDRVFCPMIGGTIEAYVVQ